MISVAAILGKLLPALHASSLGTLEYWTEAELYAIANDAAGRLARETGVFVERNPVAVTAGGASYLFPARHIAAVHVSLDGKTLRPASVAELLARSESWQDEEGAVTHYALDVAGLEIVTLYKKPLQNGTLYAIHRRAPAAVSSGSPSMRVPALLEHYFGFRVLAEARRKDGGAQMLEVAAALDERTALLEQVFRRYWGQGQ
jgi:hypothetical protein